MIAMTSNWEEKLCLPKCDMKDYPQVWAVSFTQLYQRK